MNTEAKNLLAEFAVRRGLAAFQPDAMGRHILMVDDWNISVFQAGRSLYLEATLGELPLERPSNPDPLIDMLGASLAVLASHQEVLTLGVDAETDREALFLYRLLPLSTLDLSIFDEALESFVNRLEHWEALITRAPRTLEPLMPMHILFP
jgi:hypothetical protein